MDIVRAYGNLIKKQAPERPNAALRIIKLGFALESFRTKHLANRDIPAAWRTLNHYAVGEVRKALRHPDRTVWANLFAPVEILQCFGVHTLSIEMLSSFLSGMGTEDYFMDFAENEGIAPTLCSYHKNFIGAIDSGIIPPAAFAVTTSIICDGNVCTFRHLADTHQIPSFLLDIPEHDSPEAEAYVVEQLRELIAQLEETFRKNMDYDMLREILIRENASKECYNRTLKMMRTKAYPSTLTLQMYLLFANHLNIGTPQILDFYRQMEAEVAAAPEFHGTNIFWVHLLPWYQQTLKSHFNLNPDYQIQGIELSLDYTEPLDADRPLEALAKKMIRNIYNGSYERKADMVQSVVKEIQPDGVINFCHWGCKQSAGGAMILKDKMQEIGMPFLILDGDGIDRRNSHDGQIKTRLEAFLEMIRDKEY
ncbi:MAG: 2-hydroxyacyl-CoA dehydratase family protein [Clostridiales bacterium]|nr:2-hydroxyacyl-CoA dehydratase family protein [Clostridiales bacterium]